MATSRVFRARRIKRVGTRRKETPTRRELRDHPSDACTSDVISDLKRRENDVKEGYLDWSHFA